MAETRVASASGLEARTHAGPVRLRSIVGGLTGNVIEWYDFLAYSSFAIYFAKAFFPSDKPTVQLMNTAAIAAVGYIARPLGSWLIGLYADRQGRKTSRSWRLEAIVQRERAVQLDGVDRVGRIAEVDMAGSWRVDALKLSLRQLFVADLLNDAGGEPQARAENADIVFVGPA